MVPRKFRNSTADSHLRHLLFKGTKKITPSASLIWHCVCIPISFLTQSTQIHLIKQIHMRTWASELQLFSHHLLAVIVIIERLNSDVLRAKNYSQSERIAFWIFPVKTFAAARILWQNSLLKWSLFRWINKKWAKSVWKKIRYIDEGSILLETDGLTHILGACSFRKHSHLSLL